MFPPAFVRDQIEAFTKRGDVVLDPFCGRGTAPFEALVQDRIGLGCDISPVAACISSAKLNAPTINRVLGRLDELNTQWKGWRGKGAVSVGSQAYPKFFDRAYSQLTLRQLLFLRQRLKWRSSPVDGFVASLVLAYMHGESRDSGHYLSNHMPHSIALYPQYLIRYWRKRRWKPPETDVFTVLENRAQFRLSSGAPDLRGKAVQADARTLGNTLRSYGKQARLIVTSPPYFDLVNFAKSQWLRLWFLGGLPFPAYHPFGVDDRHVSESSYFDFLSECWRGAKKLVAPKATLVCRIGAKRVSEDILKQGLLTSVRACWPRAELISAPSASDFPSRQTDTFCPGTTGCRREWDFAFRLVG